VLNRAGEEQGAKGCKEIGKKEEANNHTHHNSRQRAGSGGEDRKAKAGKAGIGRGTERRRSSTTGK